LETISNVDECCNCSAVCLDVVFLGNGAEQPVEEIVKD
jgi:hypothetical protein